MMAKNKTMRKRHREEAGNRRGAQGNGAALRGRPEAAVPTKSEAGRFGEYGGRYVPETLMAALQELELAYGTAKKDRKFQQELDRLLREFAGRPTALTFAKR